MNKKIVEMRNLGPVTAQMLAEVDIVDETDLRAVGAVEAYHRLRFRFGRRISLNALYAMEASLRGCDWREIAPETKLQLLAVLESQI